MRRPLVGVVLALTLVVGAIFMQAAAPAGAATPNAGAWVIAPQWWGWCPGGSVNRPVQVNVINYTAGNMHFSGWSGADKVHIAVVNGRTNRVQVSVLCRRSGWQSSGGYHDLPVDRNERTFFTGLGGGVYRQ